MLEVELIDQRDRTAIGSGRNGNEAVAGAASVAFAIWLHRCHREGHIVSPRDALFGKKPFDDDE